MPQWSIDLIIGIGSLIVGFFGGFSIRGMIVKQKIKGNFNIQKTEISNGNDKNEPKN